MKRDYAAERLDPRWQKMRLKVMERDGFACCMCFNESETLNVHQLRGLWLAMEAWADDPPDGYLRDFAIQREERGGYMGVTPWNRPAATVTTRSRRQGKRVEGVSVSEARARLGKHWISRP